jgi:hypothetical protein
MSDKPELSDGERDFIDESRNDWMADREREKLEKKKISDKPKHTPCMHVPLKRFCCPLHAAAPQMLEALKGLLELVHDNDKYEPKIEQARAAIRQAEGE